MVFGGATVPVLVVRELGFVGFRQRRAQRLAKSDDAGAFALQLLIAKALDENGKKLFAPGEVDILKNEVKDKDLQTLMLAILTDEYESEVDMKSSAE